MKMKKILIAAAILVVILIVLTFAVPELKLIMSYFYYRIFSR
jgi:hypothetical protein